MDDGSRFPRFEPVTGQAHDITVTLTNLSYRDTGSEKKYAYGEFGPDFIVALYDALPAPRRRGLLRSTLICPVCDAALDANAIQPVKVVAEVALRKVPPIGVDLEMPGLKCPSCDRSLVKSYDRDLQSDLSDALIDAFATVGLKPG
jgi:hypothetical protein